MYQKIVPVMSFEKDFSFEIIYGMNSKRFSFIISGYKHEQEIDSKATITFFWQENRTQSLSKIKFFGTIAMWKLQKI